MPSDKLGDDTPKIDPESPALQYRLVQRDVGVVLERTHAEFPRTPTESEFVLSVREVLPTAPSGAMCVPEATLDQLDADVGDEVSLLQIATAQMATLTAALQPAIAEITDVLNSVATTVADGISDAFSEAFRDAVTADEQSEEPDPREQRLPDRIREARGRRREQKRSEERELGDNRYGDGADV